MIIEIVARVNLYILHNEAQTRIVLKDKIIHIVLLLVLVSISNNRVLLTIHYFIYQNVTFTYYKARIGCPRELFSYNLVLGRD